ncbi:hypothetical protein [Corynebacterium sp. NML140438]|uniref:hypothetical protein n=1 Tax=Corynebacterium sp. NML140438 TaxID=1906334 RepID=UPI0011607D5F|nr:hypothetical protein [Corynebacterium sp. NML140438]
MRAIDVDAQHARCVDVASPTPSDSGLLVEVLYAGVFLDDATSGNHGCGRVLTDPQDEVAPGTMVAWSEAPGQIAEHVVVDRNRVVAVSDNIAPQVAASMLRPGIAAAYALFEVLDLVQGEAVVVTEASSPIGLYAIALARERDVIVYAVADTAEGQRAARNAGATAVFEDKPRSVSAIMALNDGIGVDAMMVSRNALDNGFACQVGRSSARTCYYEDLASISVDTNEFRKHAQAVTRMLEECRWQPSVEVLESLEDADSLPSEHRAPTDKSRLLAINLRGRSG